MSEYIEKFLHYFTDQGVSRGVAITYLVVSALIVVMAVVALVMRIIVIINYQEGNKKETKSGKNGYEIAREMLDKAGLKDVKIEKAGWFRAFFIGNCYSITKNTIFLRKGIINSNSVTSVALALQKVGVAKLCRNGSKTAKTRNIMQIVSLVGPILFVPVVLLGFVLDLVLFKVFGVFSIVGIAVGLFLVLAGFIERMLTIPVEKKANEMALSMIKETAVLDDEEIEVVKKVFKAYIIAYICEFIIAVLRLVQIVLEIVMNVQINSNKS
jgi:Zn-dependent membrane protease YugP